MIQVPDVTELPTRRDRVRAATTQEIKQTARRILVAQGPDAVSLRAIAREMGMTAPALYRYFGSHEVLIRNVIADIFNELADEIQGAISGAACGGMTDKLVAACHGFRRWALGHKDEFGLLFGAPLPGLEHGMGDIADECALKFAGTFYELFLDLWHRCPFPVPDPGEIEPGLREQLERWRDGIGSDIPVGAVLAFLRCWVLLYGAVTLDVFGHLGFALDDTSVMFEYTLNELAALVGLEYPVPGPGSPGK